MDRNSRSREVWCFGLGPEGDAEGSTSDEADRSCKALGADLSCASTEKRRLGEQL